MKIRTGDTVKILYGKDKGRTGIVVRVLRKDNKVVVEGMNVYKKHLKPDANQGADEQESGIVEIIKPMHVSKVMLVCPNCGKPSRIAIEREDGMKYRVCKKCGKRIKTGERAEKVETKAKVKLGKDFEKEDNKPDIVKKDKDQKVKTKVGRQAQSYRQTGDR